MKRTFDTDICSYVLRQRPREIIARFESLDRDDVWLSAIVAAELRFDARKLGSATFSATVEAWLAGFAIEPWPVEASHQYAIIRAELERIGQPIGNMDLMIASHALCAGAVLVTNNIREFQRVPGLALEDWGSPPTEFKLQEP